ncbi:hypothetical protein [Parvibaculum sp.]|uniref:hypothetical protein n=1 Tax=Parvibaculum sp. TaxID=2024848 RepID=UPI003C70B03A
MHGAAGRINLLIISTILLSCLPLLMVAYFSIFSPIYRGSVKSQEIGHVGGDAFSAPVPHSYLGPFVVFVTDTVSKGAASNLQLFEDGKNLGPAHSLHVDISMDGRGRFSHWGQALIFSSSDRSDPRTNGRSYSFQVKPAPSFWFLIVAIILPLGTIKAWTRQRRVDLPPWLLRTTIKIHAFFSHAVADGVPILALGLVLILALNPIDALTISTGSPNDFWRIATVMLLALGGWRLTAEKLPRPFLWVCRTFTIVLAGFAFLRSFPIDFEVTVSQPVAFHHLMVGPIAGLVFAAFAWRRPTFGFYTACVGFWYREEIERHYGFVLGHGEEKTLAGTLMMLLLLALFYYLVTSAHHSIRTRYGAEGKFGSGIKSVVFNNIVLLAVALQFSNYFHSSLRKWNLGSGSGDWILTNPTYYLLSSGDVLGVLPLAHWPAVNQWIFGQWMNFDLVSNALTFGLQLSSIVVLWFKPLLAPFILLLDLWHVGVAVLTGIVFWIWIILNVTLAVAIASIKTSPSVALRLLMTVLVIDAPAGFSIFMAGWYDTPAVNHLTIQAITDNGERIPVPPEAFRFYSYSLTMATAFEAGEVRKFFFPTTGFGTAQFPGDRKIADRCLLPHSSSTDLPPINPAVFRLLAAVQMDAAKGTNFWWSYTYPHHLFAGAGLGEYLHTDFNKVIGYQFTLDAVCAVKTGNGYRLDTLRSATEFVPISEVLSGSREIR